MKNTTVSALLIFLTALSISACKAIGPDYQSPVVPVMESFSTQDTITFCRDADMKRWWEKLEDPTLDRLISHAISKNQDVRIAVFRILEARANKGLATSETLPSFDANASVNALRSSKTGLDTANLPSTIMEDYDATQILHEGGFDASWEIDLFGRIKRSIEAADAEIGASESDLADTMVALLCDVAKNYVEIRKVQAQTDVVTKNLDLQQKTLDLIEKRFKSGMDTQLNITTSKALIADTKARIPQLAAQQKTLRHRLAILLGEAPDFLISILDNNPQIPSFPEKLVVGIPADLLRVRPDIRTAERQLAAQVARIGVAKADFYPRLGFNGSIGLSSVDLGEMTLDNSWTGSIGPSFSWAIFNGGAVRARVAAADARSKQALALYEKTVFHAYEEVENALVQHKEELLRKVHLKTAVAENTRAYELSLRLYTCGLADYIHVLDSERNLLNSKERFIESLALVTDSVIELHKAFGGGLAVR